MENENLNINENMSSNKKNNKPIIIGIIGFFLIIAAIVVIVIIINRGHDEIQESPPETKLVGGKWTLIEVEENGKTYTSDMLKLMGATGILEFKGDKTGKIELFGTTTDDVSYDEQYITIDGDPTPYSVNGVELILETSKLKMVFTNDTILDDYTESNENNTVKSNKTNTWDDVYYENDKSDKNNTNTTSTVGGKWKLIEVTEEGQKYDASKLKIMGMEGLLVLNLDKTGTLDLFGTKSQLTWDDKNITADGQSVEYSISGNKLTITDNGTEMVFEKE